MDRGAEVQHDATSPQTLEAESIDGRNISMKRIFRSFALGASVVLVLSTVTERLHAE
jgi:hypothetical protein